MPERWWEPPRPFAERGRSRCRYREAVRPGGGTSATCPSQEGLQQAVRAGLRGGRPVPQMHGASYWKGPALTSLLCPHCSKFLVIYELGAPRLLIWHCPSEIVIPRATHVE